MNSFFVTGTDTDIGKTFVCSLLVSAFSKRTKTCYYKPIQSGSPKDQDQVIRFIKDKLEEPKGAFFVKKSHSPLFSNSREQNQTRNRYTRHSSLKDSPVGILKSTYCLNAPLSPWQSSQIEGRTIETGKIAEVFKNRPRGICVVEGAGGIEVPINENQKIKDMISILNLPVLLVTTTKLGTINHTLLSIQALKAKGIHCLGLVLNEPAPAKGEEYKQTPDEFKEKSHNSHQRKLQRKHHHQSHKKNQDNQGLWLKNFFEKETGLPVLFRLPCFKNPVKKKIMDFFETNEDFNRFIENCLDELLNKKNFQKKIFPNETELYRQSFPVEKQEDKKPGSKKEKADSLEKLDRQFVWHPFTQHGIVKKHTVIERAKGVYLWYKDQKIIDAISSWWVNLFGHCHPLLSGELCHQSHELEHILFAGFSHRPAIELSEKLINLTNKKACQFKKVFFSDNGSTSVEVALKMVYQYQQLSGQKNKKRFLALKGSYHGDTLGAMSLGEREGFNQFFKPLFFPVDFADPFNPDSLESLFHQKGEEFCAVIVEPMVQGAGGMLMYPPEFLNKLAKLTKEYKVMVICDEVFTGFYRTGKMFAFEHSQIKPDLLCLSKGLTGGYLPLAVTLTSEEFYKAFLDKSMKKAFLHGHSYTANPMACRVASATLKLLEEPETLIQVERIKNHTRHWMEKLNKNPKIFNGRHLGTIGAMELSKESPHYFKGDFSHAFYQKALEEGVLLRPLGGTVYALPPYCTNEEQIDKIYSSIEKIVARH